MGLKQKIQLKDKICFRDEMLPDRGLWARTEVIGGYGDFIMNPTGKSTLGETIFEGHNMVPIGGVQYAFEQIFGVKGTQIDVPTMYDSNGIGLPNSLAPTETYLTPDGEHNIVYRPGHRVQLFGIGITGTAENDITVYPVDYREKDINLSKVSNDGQTIKGTMLPFRHCAELLSEVDRKKYFGKKTGADKMIDYYLKRFEQDPQIKHIWKTGENTDDETLVSSSEVWTNLTGKNVVESFTEFYLKISKKDVKEWFIEQEQEDRTRITTIALFDGYYVRDLDDASDYGDYQDVRMFSKLNIPVEYLSLSKDLNIIYRVYGS